MDPKEKRKIDPSEPESNKRVKKVVETAKKKTSEKAKVTCPKKAKGDIEELAQKYADVVNNSEGVVRWDEIGKFDRNKRSEIRNHARDKGLIPKVEMVECKDRKDKTIECPIFPDDRVIVDVVMDEKYFDKTDVVQFEHLNSLVTIEGYDPVEQTLKDEETGIVKKYTWHHHHEEGRMQLVESGIHSATKHKGGREIWTTGPRK